MPLSDHEQRVLEQMEQALYAEDPRFASNLKSSRGGTSTRRRAVVGTLLVIAGLGLVILAVTQQMIWLGGLGFGAMVLGGALIFAPRPQGPQLGSVQSDGTVSPGGSTAVKGAAPKRGKPSGRSGGSFMQRMEQRWEKRRDDGPR